MIDFLAFIRASCLALLMLTPDVPGGKYAVMLLGSIRALP